ncbi:MAG: hypothetical protein QXH64_03425 [Nitrososphaeria archaeon]
MNEHKTKSMLNYTVQNKLSNLSRFFKKNIIRYSLPITLKLDKPRIKNNSITFVWKASGPIPGFKKNEWRITYPKNVNLSVIPRELLWLIYAMMTSELLAETSKINIVLPEKLDERFLELWKGVLSINHKANPYHNNLDETSDFNIFNGKEIVEVKSSQDDYNTFEFACMNSLGKDALVQIGMLRELTQEQIIAITIDNHWQFKKQHITSKIVERTRELKKYGVESCVVASPVKETFAFKIIPWQIFAIPLLYLYGVKICLWALELPFNKCYNGIPVKPNATVIMLEAINKLLNDLGYRFRFKSGVTPITTLGTMKLLIERYPELQKLQISCMYDYPPCSKCLKCQSQMAYIKLCGSDYREFGFRDTLIINANKLYREQILDLEREPIEYAISKANGFENNLNWVEKYWYDALAYTIPGIKKILDEHFEEFKGKFFSYDIYEYDVDLWKKNIEQIYS